MKIQVNKHYINAGGDVIFIKEYGNGVRYPFEDEDYNYYDVHGRYVNNDTNDTYDLICECVPDILAYYIDNCITQKEFIQQHIDYYQREKNESIIN